MTFSRCLAATVCSLILSGAAHANLFEAHVSTRTYSLNGHGSIKLQIGNDRQFIDLAVQNTDLDAKTLVLVYDTDADALEVVRKADGSLISTVMTFSDGLDIENAKKTHAYRQTFLTISGSDAMVTGSNAVVSGSDTVISGSVAGPIRIEYDGHANIIAYRWDGDFQYSIPGDLDTPNRVVHGRFTLGREVKVRNPPPT